jgi:hypothetical protein
MGQRFEAGQSEKAAGAFDGMNQAKDVIQNPGVVRLLLELHQLVIDGIQTLTGFRQELPQQIIHETGFRTQGRATAARLSELGQLLRKAFNIG